jgi:hypothetical protein
LLIYEFKMAKGNKTNKTNLTFHNKISSNFRQVHVDGAYGGLTPPGFINLNFYGERFPIPKSSEYELKDDFSLGDKISDSGDSKTGIVREYEFGIYFDLKTAISIRNFLNERITELENIQNKKNASITK